MSFYWSIKLWVSTEQIARQWVDWYTSVINKETIRNTFQSDIQFVPWRGGTGVNETGRFALCYVTQEQTGEADTPTKLITSLNLQLGWKPNVAHFGVIPAVTWSETQLWVNLSSWWRARNLNRMIPVVWLQARKHSRTALEHGLPLPVGQMTNHVL